MSYRLSCRVPVQWVLLHQPTSVRCCQCPQQAQHSRRHGSQAGLSLREESSNSSMCPGRIWLHSLMAQGGCFIIGWGCGCSYSLGYMSSKQYICQGLELWLHCQVGSRTGMCYKYLHNITLDQCMLSTACSVCSLLSHAARLT